MERERKVLREEWNGFENDGQRFRMMASLLHINDGTAPLSFKSNVRFILIIVPEMYPFLLSAR